MFRYMAKYRKEPFKQTLAITKALADEQRLRALMALAQGELCACQVIELLELAPSTVSRHLSVLRQAGLVVARKQGRWHYFRQPDGDAAPEARSALEWLSRSLAASPQIREDRRRLKQILKTNPEELCKKQCLRC